MQTNPDPTHFKPFAYLFEATFQVMLQYGYIISADLWKNQDTVDIHLDTLPNTPEFFAKLDPDYTLTIRKNYDSTGPRFTVTARYSRATIIAILTAEELRQHFPDRADHLILEWHLEYGDEASTDDCSS